ISVGGVGKTPFVELLVRRLTQRGRKVAIVSRGYRRKSTGTVVVSNGEVKCAEADATGDEPAQMSEKLPGVVVVVDELRVRGAQYAREHFDVDIIVLDDGFQHRYLKRDLDVALVSADEVFSRDWLLPAGNRRESLGALRRADLLVVSHVANREHWVSLEGPLHAQFRKPAIGVRVRVRAFKKAVSGFSVDLKSLDGKRVVAFSGIGIPEGFEETMRSLQLEVVKHFRFPDHHRFSVNDLKEVETTFQHTGADYLVTTEKDIVRLKGSGLGARELTERAPLFYVEIEHEVIAGEQHLTAALARI
ncbi:MAG: tetraacyldisaccharide 4'-kinase, partial [Ignavibacteria bacterium]|nr:tetraacyldisaccharide 4'-kinase [Ignavibacteria bacterium]